MASGFFSVEETKSKTRPSGNKAFSCASCGLYKDISSPRMAPFGEFEKKIMVIGDMPSSRDDRVGKPWQDRFGTTLRREFERRGVDLFKDCLNLFALSCYALGSKETTNPWTKEVQCCRRRVLSAIEQYKPKVIILVGELALNSVIGSIWTKNLGGMTKWRGFTIPDRKYNAWICPIFHPSYVEAQDAQEYRTVWKQDLDRALHTVDMSMQTYPDEMTAIKIVESESELVGIFEEFLSRKFPFPIAIDYETTGLKPHDTSKHKIICMSMCSNPEDAIVFGMPKSKKGNRLLKEILQSDKIGKIAQNLKFEHTWTQNILGYEVKNWIWDTMLATHILDNRPDITGLKIQTYINFGVAGYDDEVAPYLKGADDKDSNSMNKLLDVPVGSDIWNKLLIYCGMDSLFTYRLATRQKQWIQQGGYIGCN